MSPHNNRTYSAATRFSVAFSIIAALMLPLGYFSISFKYLKGIMETEAEINSKIVSRMARINPDLWRYETVRLEELLERRPRSGTAETRRIFDHKNELVAESVNFLNTPRVTTSHQIIDGGNIIGRIEISRSILPLLLKAGVLALAGLAFGLMFYRWLPFQALIKTGKQLQDANDFLKKVMEGSTNSLVVLNLEGSIQMCNGRFEALSGYTREELMGQRFYDLFSANALKQVESELRKVSSAGAEHITFETEFTRQDGLLFNLFCGATPLFTEGVVSGVVVSLDDVTERINAEENRLELERQLQQTQKLESLGVLAGGIAHDFNNILTIILGYCYACKDDDVAESVKADYVRKIEGAANRAGDLCRQMLSYAGKNELQHSPVKIDLLVDEMVKMLQAGIKKNVSIELDLRGTGMILADNSQIQQLVMNLIINAAEAIGDNHGTIQISLGKTEIHSGQRLNDFTGTAIPAGKYVCLEVSDNGCGMDMETQKRIFEPFYTTKFAGRGLGMSATLGIIKSHDGALQMSSNVGDGTNFKVYLPSSERFGFDGITSSSYQTHLMIRDKGTVLLVDDEDELRTLGTIRLKKIGFSALTASNGLEALEIYQEHEKTIDLILLDLLMPEMDGVETYRRLREISHNIPIIFCSGCSRKELTADILEDDYVRYLTKPYHPVQMQNLLGELLQ